MRETAEAAICRPGGLLNGRAADLGFPPAVLTPGYHMPPWRAPILLLDDSGVGNARNRLPAP